MEWTQYSIRLEAVHYLCTSCLLPAFDDAYSVTCLRLNDVSVICRVTYFQFLIQSDFSMSVSQVAQLRTGLRFSQYRTSNVAENLDRYLYCTKRIAQENDFKLILTVKMETRHPVDGSFGSKFRVICNHCVVVATWRRKTLKIFWKIFAFFGKKRHLMVKFPKFCTESFYRDSDKNCVQTVCCVQISWNLAADGKSVYFSDQKTTKFCLPLQLSLLFRSRPKSTRSSPQQCP